MSAAALEIELERLRALGGPLAALGDDDLARLAAELEEVHCPKGVTLIAAGEAADALFLVLEGRLAVTTLARSGEPTTLGEVGAGELVGEIALLVGGERTADVRASEPARLAKLSRARFDELLAESPALWRRMIELVGARLRRLELLPHLHRIFGPFAPEESGLAEGLANAAETVSLRRGTALFAPGDEIDAAHLVLSGLVGVERAPGDDDAPSEREVGRGELIGAAGLLTGGERRSAAHALRDSELARIPRTSFLRIAERSSHVALRLATQVVVRSASEARPAPRRTGTLACVALVPSSREISVEPLATELAQELRRHGSVALLSSESVDAALGRPGIAQAPDADPTSLRLTSWLREQEERHRFVILRADRGWTPWTARCAGLADRVAVVADASASPEPGEIERRLTAPVPGVRGLRPSLLLLHPPGLALPSGTARWLAVRNVDEVYHLRVADARDLARVARLLGGRAIGIVLGGGGARGFAHLGVIRALEELGVPIDLVGGASIGAPVGFPTAKGLDADSARELVRREFSALLDYTLPVASLLSGRRAARAIRRQAGDVDIEDLWLPYFCVSTNLSTAESCVHRRGELARALRASVSIPGVFPPVPHGDDLLVDGGLLNNLPIDVMRERNPHGTVIAIDVAPPRGPGARGDFGLAVSGWGLAFERLQPWRRKRRVPALAATLLQSQIVAANRSRQRMLDAGLADFYRNIHVKGVGMLEFEKVDTVARLGYEDALEPLRAWVESGGLGTRSVPR